MRRSYRILIAPLSLASQIDISGLKTAIAAASEASIIAVGSGGSFTVASVLLHGLHEAYTGRVSRAVTPLELICNPTLASASPIFVISAEGKNPDVIEALQRARKYSSRAVHVLTNRTESPLMECVSSLKDVTPHVFELKDKDGYLATNSLVLDASLVARAYGQLDQSPNIGPSSIEQVQLGGRSLSAWLSGAKGFVTAASGRNGLIIVFSPRLRAVARRPGVKVFRSGADARSVVRFSLLCAWASSLVDATIERHRIAGSDRTEHRFALRRSYATRNPRYPRFALKLSSAQPHDLIGGLIASMHLISEIANSTNRDIARPEVSPLGKSLYYAKLSKLIPPPAETEVFGEDSKYQVLGAHWPTPRTSGKTRRALTAAHALFAGHTFRSIVFDYDGTLCSSNSADLPPSDEIIAAIVRLLEAGVIVGIASGRGGSIGENIQAKIEASLWPG